MLGAFTLLAVAASFAVAAYYDDIKSTRKHYAHSVSVLVIFEVFQSIYLSGAFNVKWPNVLPAWWSNFAWASGMISVHSMQLAISKFAGVHQIDDPHPPGSAAYSSITQGLPGAAEGFTWFGYRQAAGLPIPGDGTGFATTLAHSGNIIVENAFTTGLIWFLVLLLAVTIAIPVLRLILELLAFLWLLDRKKLTYFRENWLTYTRLAVLRTAFVAFFVLLFLSLYEFTRSGPAGVEAVASLVFIFVLLGMLGVAIYAYHYQTTHSEYEYEAGGLSLNMEQISKEPPMEQRNVFPWPGMRTEYEAGETSLDMARIHREPLSEQKRGFLRPGRRSRDLGAQSTTRRGLLARCKQLLAAGSPPSPERAIHSDTGFTKRFGWLTARYTNRRWWFFLAWLIYQFVRAIFLAGAVASPLTQIFCSLIVDIIAFIGFLLVKPFEGERLNLLVAYFLGISKIATTILSVTFYAPFNVSRIAATAIGIIIIVIQGVLTIVLVATIVTGLFTSYWSVTRNEAKESASNIRTKFLHRVDANMPPPKEEQNVKKSPKFISSLWKKFSRPPQHSKHNSSGERFFDLGGMRRLGKIDDDNDDLRPGTDGGNSHADLLRNGRGMGNRNSTYSTLHTLNSANSYGSLPFGARNIIRSSWSSRDFGSWEQRPSHERSNVRPEGSTALSDTMLLPRRSGDDRYAVEEDPTRQEYGDLLPLPQAYPYVNRSSRVFSSVTATVGDRHSVASSNEIPPLGRPSPRAFDSSPLEYPPALSSLMSRVSFADEGPSSHPPNQNSHAPRGSFADEAPTRNSYMSRVSFADELDRSISASPQHQPPTVPPHRVPVVPRRSRERERELPRRDDGRWAGQRFETVDLPVPVYEGPPPSRSPF